MTAAQRPCFKMPTGLLSRYPVYCNICTKTLSQNSKRQRAYFLDTKSVVTDAQEPRRENSKCQQTSRADFPHALCTAAGPRHKGVAPSKTKEDDSAVTGFRVSITVQQRRVGLWTGLGTSNNVPCMQQVPATATQGSKRVGSSKCNPSRVYKNK